jgi:hypothetical protein
VKIRKSFCISITPFVLTAILVAPGFGATVLHRNVVDLIALSEVIVVGTVSQVTDGFDPNGVPYTEITMAVKESIRGNESGTYTFRQFGLLAPRDMGNGMVNLNTTLDGWPNYKQNQEVVLFLYKEASLTGFRTTVGLLQGKFDAEGDLLANAINNRGLFQNINVDPQVLSAAEQKLLDSSEGPMNRETFVGFVRNAVAQGWVETGKVTNAKQ